MSGTALEKIKGGNTQQEVKERINAGLTQIDANREAIEAIETKIDNGEIGGGDVQDVYVNGTSVVNEEDKIARVVVIKSITVNGEKAVNGENVVSDDGTAANIPVPTKTSDLKNDLGFLTSTSAQNTFYTEAEINTKLATLKSELQGEIGNIVGGMDFKGTVGEGGTVKTLPTTNVKSGDVYKVIAYGWYNNEYADVGDLFIASVTNDGITWYLVPSGDDGDVYAESNFSITNEIVVSSGLNTKKVKGSGKSIVTPDLVENDKSYIIPEGYKSNVPTVYSVVNALREVRMYALPFSDFEKGKNTTTMDERYNTLYFTCTSANLITTTQGKVYNMLKNGFKPVSVWGGTNGSIFTDIKLTQTTTSYTITLDIDNTLQDTVVDGGGVVYLANPLSWSGVISDDGSEEDPADWVDVEDNLPYGCALDGTEIYVDDADALRSFVPFDGEYSIRENAFENALNIEGVVFTQAYVPIIGAYAFSGCTNLAYIDLNCNISDFVRTYKTYFKDDAAAAELWFGALPTQVIFKMYNENGDKTEYTVSELRAWYFGG